MSFIGKANQRGSGTRITQNRFSITNTGGPSYTSTLPLLA